MIQYGLIGIWGVCLSNRKKFDHCFLRGSDKTLEVHCCKCEIKWYEWYKTNQNLKYLQFLEKWLLKFEWYSGTNGTKLLRTENLCKL